MAVVLLEHPAEHVALLRLNRPEVRNALNMEMRRALARHFRELGEREDVRVIVLTGNERAFAAGADLREMAELDAIEAMQRGTHRLWQAIADCPKPIVAAVNGYAYGGGMELALHADIILAGESARFAQPEVRVGILPGAGGTQRLLRAVGRYRAAWLTLLGEPVSAREAEAMGFVSRVVPDAEVVDAAVEVAAKIARLPPLAVMEIKELLRLGGDASLEAALALERRALWLMFASEDQKEGMRAFLEKRAPQFRGR